MPIDTNFYMHDSDRAALKALKAIPGFTAMLKAQMQMYDERQFQLLNMSSNLRISEKQLPKYYHMLLPICEKLGIEVPELYLELDVNPNSYTYGDTKPIIVMTTGLLETMPEHLIPTVLAHECGHIACHHILYHSMCNEILNETSGAWKGSDLLASAIPAAFSYWRRCSEYSADRAAAICDGTADKVVEMCMRLAGYDKDIGMEVSVDAFLEQAVEYKKMVKDSMWNKALEFDMCKNVLHPLNAVRAYECDKWAKTEQFQSIKAYAERGEGAIDGVLKVPVHEPAKYYIGKNVNEVTKLLQEAGFTNIQLHRVYEKGILTQENDVTGITIDGQDDFKARQWYACNAEIVVQYCKTKSEAEIAAEHPGECKVPESAKRYVGRECRQVEAELRAAGFTNVSVGVDWVAKANWNIKAGDVSGITIGGDADFKKDNWYPSDTAVRILRCEDSK